MIVRGRGGVAVYAAAAGLTSAIPVPFLDGFLSEMARGAAMRRVAARSGVRLSPRARSVLAAAGATKATSSSRGRLLKTALSRALLPLRVASRVEDAVGTFVSAALLEHYLKHADRPARAVLTEEEALRVRRATEVALIDAGFDAIKTVPLGLFGVLREAGQEVFDSDDEEGRSAAERFIDALLDGLDRGPDEFFANLAAHFDRQLQE